MKVLLQNFNRKSNKFEIGRQEMFHSSIEGLKNFISKIPYDTSNKTIPIKIITEDLIFEKLDHQNIKYDWNFYYTYRFTRKKKIVNLRELDQLIEGSKKGYYSGFIDTVIIFLYFIAWVSLLSFNTPSLQNFLFIENINQNVNIFFIWLLILTWIGFLNYTIKNFIINLIFYRKKFVLNSKYTIIDDIKVIDITNFLLFSSQYFYIIFIFYYFPSANLKPEGLVLYISLLVIGSTLVTQELLQICKDLYINYKKKMSYLDNLYTLMNYNKNEENLNYMTTASDLKKVNLIDQRLWKILISLLIFLLSLLPIL